MCINTSYRNTKIQITEIQKYKLQKYRNVNYINTNYRNTNPHIATQPMLMGHRVHHSNLGPKINMVPAIKNMQLNKFKSGLLTSDHNDKFMVDIIHLAA